MRLSDSTARQMVRMSYMWYAPFCGRGLGLFLLPHLQKGWPAGIIRHSYGAICYSRRQAFARRYRCSWSEKRGIPDFGRYYFNR